MEGTRRFLNFIFWVVFIAGAIGLVIIFFGGAIPINMGMGEHTVKFDVAHIGWEVKDPKHGSLKITHERKDIKKGWGALEYTYDYAGKEPPIIFSQSNEMEGLLSTSFYMKSKKPSKWQMQIKRKSDGTVFTYTFDVGPEWKLYKSGVFGFKCTGDLKGKFDSIDLAKWVRLVDLSKRKDDKNTVWLDNLVFSR